MSGKDMKAMRLDVESSILEDNLRIVKNDEEDGLNKLFGKNADTYPSKLVKPFPGLCIKTKLVGKDTKFFVNICQTDAIPAPKDIGEQDLHAILDSDEPSSFRVPMSIGEIRQDFDKKGVSADVCDVAINPKFFKKINDSSLFKNFFLTIVFEGLKDKYGVVSTDGKMILNRKVFGTLQMHRIQQREIEDKMGMEKNPIDKLDDNMRKPIIETISSSDNIARIPDYRLFLKKDDSACLYGEFHFPDVLNVNELTLDVGEDRILIESQQRNYLLDIFIPHYIRQKSCISTFEKSTKILTLKMPLIGG